MPLHQTLEFQKEYVVHSLPQTHLPVPTASSLPPSDFSHQTHSSIYSVHSFVSQAYHFLYLLHHLLSSLIIYWWHVSVLHLQIWVQESSEAICRGGQEERSIRPVPLLGYLRGYYERTLASGKEDTRLLLGQWGGMPPASGRVHRRSVRVLFSMIVCLYLVRRVIHEFQFLADRKVIRIFWEIWPHYNFWILLL